MKIMYRNYRNLTRLSDICIHLNLLKIMQIKTLLKYFRILFYHLPPCMENWPKLLNLILDNFNQL